MDLGRIAYEAYASATGGKSLITDDTLPSWGDLPEEVIGAWQASATAVNEALERQRPPVTPEHPEEAL